MRNSIFTALILSLVVFVAPPTASAISLETEKTRRADGLAIRSQIQAWDNALVENTPHALERVLSSEYFGSGVTLDLYIQALEAMGVEYTESSRDNVEIRFYGDTAFVSGQWTQRGNNSQFGNFMSTFQFTDLWVKHDGSWNCVATSPNQMRKAFAKLKPVHIGPDVKSDLVILFNLGVVVEDIEEFRKAHFSDSRETLPNIRSYTKMSSVQNHTSVALQLKGTYSDIQLKFFVQALLREPIVFRVFENIAPDDIVLGE